MKVLFVYRYLSLGGVEAVLRARLDHLDRWGIDGHAWFLHDRGGRAVFAGREHRIRIGSPTECLRWCKEDAFDLLDSIDTDEIFSGFTNSRPSPCLVVECHSHYLERLEYLRRLRSLRPAGILVPSEHQLRIVRERTGPGIDIQVVPNALREAFVRELEPFSPVPPRPVVAWIGRLDDLKNWRGFVEVAATLCREGAETEFWVVGEPDEPTVPRELLKLAGDRGVLPRLRWFRGLPHDRVPPLLDAVRDSGGVVVSMSRGEAFGMTVAEAMARCCVVAVPDQAPFTEFVTHGATGLLFPPGSAEAAANLVQTALADAALRARLGESARESVLARFAPERALAALAHEFRRLAQLPQLSR
jgi:glycosyltransferase involved in cell wall biosynthesis